MIHLTQRVAWHEQGWDGTVCKHPTENSFCTMLDRVREARDDEAEKFVAGKALHELTAEQMPACIAEAGAFMNAHQWVRLLKHPYQNIPKAVETHGHLKPKEVPVPPYSTFAVPFWWMLKENQANIDQIFKEPLPPDEDAPFNTAWVFSLDRQVELNQYFFNRIKPQKSLVFFYCKEGQPLGEDIIRLVIGVGMVENVSPLTYFNSNDSSKRPYPVWDRLIRHSIRPGGANGLLLPYHEYLHPTGDPEEDKRRTNLLQEITVTVPNEYVRQFSYMADHADSDVALAVLLRIQETIQKIQQHGIVDGPWDARQEWINTQIARLWAERGAFPGVGAALEAIGLRLGTSLVQELYEYSWIKPEEDPWPKLDELLRGFIKIKDIPIAPYKKHLENVRRTYNMLDLRRTQLLKLLSRFSLTPQQMKRWINPEERPVSISDQQILDNPYRICECDLGDQNEPPISIGTIDRGMLPEASIAARHPVPEPSVINGGLDVRRVRGAIVTILRDAAERGDTFLSQLEVLDRISKINLVQPCDISGDWINGNIESMQGVIERLSIPLARQESVDEKEIPVLQLSEVKAQEDELRKILRARALKPVPTTGVDWKELIIETLKQRGHTFDPTNKRHINALDDQAEALEKVTTRRLSVLTGRAGTGKTSALGALFLCEPLKKGGVLLLAPTGKARVRMGLSTGAEAKTIAQFLNERDRFDGKTLQPKFTGKDPYGIEKTVVIDECSMLTLDYMYALFKSLDLGHIQRIILVGDPNQLPPIGMGRPFADLCAMLENAEQAEDLEIRNLAGALGRLSVEVRTKDNRQSDTLRLASWFTREPQQVDADKVFNDLESDEPLNDLDIQYWENSDQLRTLIFDMFTKHLGVESVNDYESFNKALGIENSQVDYFRVDDVENFQILSPVRMHPYGVHELNRLIQNQFRKKELREARRAGRSSLGNEEIVLLDKVIQLKNEYRSSFNWQVKQKGKLYIANGEIGLLSRADWNSKWVNVSFAGRSGVTFSYGTWDFIGGSGPLELAYALTVHKSQGSEFDTTFIILPEKCRLVTRELLYTAMTRSRQQLVLLVEGKKGDISFLHEFSRPESSEVARRNTNLFRGVVRVKPDEPPYAEHLIHKTEKGHMVRSKSELVIANKLYQIGVQYEYERPYVFPSIGMRVWPDFRFTDPSGDTILWEHLGMLHKDEYRESWERKLALYLANGFIEGANLFTTRDDENGGLDSTTVSQVAEKIKTLI